MKIYQLLHKILLGERKKMLTKYAVHILMEVIQETWNSNTSMTSLLILDILGAFDNVSHQRLLHNLRKWRIPPALTDWIGSFLWG